MNRITFLRAAFLACAVFLSGSSLVFAQKGKPTPPPDPPPTPGNPFLIYEWRPDLGGWLDKNTNLVWGYNWNSMLGTSTHSGYGISHKKATENAAIYSTILLQHATTGLPNAAAQTDLQADWQVAQGDADLAAGDEERALLWYAAADQNYAKAQDDRDSIPLFIEAATVAERYTWRLPTQTEAQTAIANRLFTYGDGGFNGYDGSPYVGFQEPWNSLCWSSALSKSSKEA